jgi:hypothetical protein
MIEELVKRLRLWGDYALTSDRADLLTAADAIEGLQAQVRHLTNELQAHKDALAQAAPKP